MNTFPESIKPYPVISRNVIRQALSWSNIPLPSVSLQAAYRWPDGSVSCSYVLTWKRVQVENAQGEGITHDGSAAYMRFLDKLRGAFAGDVTVINLFSQQGESMTAELYCKLFVRAS